MKIESTRDIPSSAPGMVGVIADLITSDAAMGMIKGVAKITADVFAKTDLDIQRDPKVLLKKLCLPETLISLLEPAIKELGYAIELDEKKIKTPYNIEEKRSITAIKNQNWQGWFAHIHKWILDNPSDSNKQAIWELMVILRRAFGKNDKLFVLSEKLNAPHITFERMIEDELKGIEVKFIAWRHIEYLQNHDKTDLTKFVEAVKDVFPLEKSLLSPKNIGKVERDKIRNILITKIRQAEKSDIGIKDYLTGLVEQAGLSEDWRNEIRGQLKNDAVYSARTFVSWAIKMELIPDTQEYTLIRLLEELKPNVGGEDKKFLEGIIAQYNMIPGQ